MRRSAAPRNTLPAPVTLAGAYADESDHDVVLRLHHPDPGPAAITLSYPFSWFTGDKCDEEDRQLAAARDTPTSSRR